MPEVLHTVQAIEVEYICDYCQKGSMKSINIMLPVDPPLYKHQCDNCNQQQNLHHVYPTFRFKRT